jgi:hypothetical protein
VVGAPFGAPWKPFRSRHGTTTLKKRFSKNRNDNRSSEIFPGTERRIFAGVGKIDARKTCQFGAICTTAGNLCLYGATRTSNQAVMSRAIGLGGLELATKRL